MPKCVRLPAIMCFLLFSAGCQFRQDVSPGLEPQHEDFARARSGFKTKLVRRGPSPQAGEPLRTPAGADEVEYRSGDLILKAFVTPDPGDGRRHPAVLFLHGGFAFGGDDWDMPQPYRDAGFVVMIPILRGENGQPGSYTMFYDEVDDVLAASAALASLPYTDSSRIFVSGDGAGGTLAMLAAMASDRFRAAASLSGSPDRRPTPCPIRCSSRSINQTCGSSSFALRSRMRRASSLPCGCTSGPKRAGQRCRRNGRPNWRSRMGSMSRPSKCRGTISPRCQKPSG